MYWPKIETPRLKSNEKLAGPTIVIEGFILSLWTNCVFIRSISRYGYGDDLVTYVVFIAFLTHIIISIASSFALVEGFRTNDPDLLKPWMYVKTIELTVVLIGIIVDCVAYYRPYLDMLPVGIIVLLTGSYLFLCIYTAWKKMKDNQPPPKPTNNLDLESVNLEMPPSYDDFNNQTIIK